MKNAWQPFNVEANDLLAEKNEGKEREKRRENRLEEEEAEEGGERK